MLLLAELRSDTEVLNLLPSFHSLLFTHRTEREKQEAKNKSRLTLKTNSWPRPLVHTVVLFHAHDPPKHFFLWLEKEELSQILERYIVFIFIRPFALNRAIAIKMW